MASLRVASLFCGAGGLDLGLAKAGHRLVWANDFDHDAVETYRLNLGEHVEEGPIQSVDLASIPEADAVVGGFPCQGFSQANLKRHVRDDRNALYRYFLATLEELQPKYFLAENVRGILSLGQGRVVSRIIQDFADRGYHVDHQLFNLADFGVPQARMRVIFAGTRTDLHDNGQGYQFPRPTHAREPQGELRRWATLREGLAAIPSDTPVPNDVGSEYKVTARNFTGHRIPSWDKPSPTILARGNGGGGVCAIPHPSGRRRLTVRESAALQTFPHDFEFVGSINSCYRQVGNAVPPLFGQHLGRQLQAAESGAQMKLVEVMA